MPDDVSTPAFWDATYAEQRDRWELGEAAPPLVRAVTGTPPWIAPRDACAARAIVIGCGRGHEVRLLAAAGWAHVVGVDFATAAIADATRATPAELAPRITWQQADLFALPGDVALAGTFDLVLEHTSLCAIDPARRAEWFAAVAALLAPGGALLALFYPHARPGGPPFGATRDELAQLATAAGFTVARAETPADSIARRAGEEWLVLAHRDRDGGTTSR